MESIRLNVGCCDMPKSQSEGWVNVDLSTSEHIKADLICDATDLSKHFKPNTVDEIYASHLLEHFYPEQGKKAVKHWYELLKPGGTLTVVVPDFKYFAQEYLNGDIDINEFNDKYIYSYVQESHHRYMFDQESLMKLMSEIGFSDIRPVDRYQDPLLVYKVAWQVGVKCIK